MLTRRSALGHVTAAFAGAGAVSAAAQKAPPQKPPLAPATTPPLVPLVPPVPAPLIAVDRPAIKLPAGVHLVSVSMAIKADVMLEPGAKIEVAAGKTLTFLGDFQAPVSHVFIGPGRVDLNRSRAPVAYPEWWGAARDNSAVDCLPALQACLEAHPFLFLGAADYFISRTWQVETQHRRIWGSGKNWRGPNQGTRIIVTNGEMDVMTVGPERAPSSVNAYLKNLDIRWLELSRAAAPASAGSRPTGLRMRHVLDCHVEAVSATEHAIGFAFQGVVHSHIRDCQAFRSVPGSNLGASFWGFHFDGTKDIGLAGGNASIFVQDCNASVGGNPRLQESVGALLQGGYADTFLDRFESSGTVDGLRVDGMTGLVDKRLSKAGHANLHINAPVLDGFSGTGMEVRNTSDYAVIDIVDPYFGAANGAVAALSIRNGKGMTSVTGGQAIGWLDGEGKGGAHGLIAVSSTGLSIAGFKILGFARPVSFEGCTALSIDVAVHNPGQKASQAAILISNCSESHVLASVRGGAGVFPQGFQVKGKFSRLTVDCARVQDGALMGGKASRVTSANAKKASSIEGLTILGL